MSLQNKRVKKSSKRSISHSKGENEGGTSGENVKESKKTQVLSQLKACLESPLKRKGNSLDLTEEEKPKKKLKNAHVDVAENTTKALDQNNLQEGGDISEKSSNYKPQQLRLLATMDEEDMINAFRVYGLTKEDKKLFRYMSDEYGRMIEGTFKYIPHLKMSDIAVEATGEKNGKRWKAWRSKFDGSFVKGSFIEVEEIKEESTEEMTDETEFNPPKEGKRYSQEYL
jgi:hypothetical protein